MSYDSANRADLEPYWGLKLGHLPQLFVDNYLPNKFEEESVSIYNDFIQNYGTHFFKDARVSIFKYFAGFTSPLMGDGASTGTQGVVVEKL